MKTKKLQIKNLKPGMKIKTLSPDTGEVLFKEVIDVWESDVLPKNRREIIFDDGNIINCSNKHPFITTEMSQKLPDNLLCGDKICSDNKEYSSVMKVNNVTYDNKFIDITVDDVHTFFVSSQKDRDMVLTHNSQGGIRGGAATLYTMLWHYEIEDVLVLKNNKGTPDNRVRKLDYGIQINNYLYKRLMNMENITLFSPHEVPDLYKAFFEDSEKFAELYEKYERSRSVRKKVISAKELFTKMMVERKDTGRIYIFNVDNVNNHSAFTVPIKMSNLCAEITLPTKPLNNVMDESGEIALCTLSAFNLGNLKSLDDFDGWAKNAVYGLDNLLDYQDYIVPAAKTSTMKYRPLGIGIINLAYYLAKNDLKYSDKDAWELIHETIEAMQFYMIKASIELAKEKGPCLGLENTKYGQGLLPIDHYNKNVDEIVKPNYKMDWEWLRSELKTHGIRNATLSAYMPAETSCKLSNATNGVEPVRSLITIKGSKANISKQVVPEIFRLKNKYDMLWDMNSMEGVIKCMAVITKFTDQSISTNLSYNPQHFPKGEIPMSTMLKDLLLCNKYGIKTLYYHNTNDNREENLSDEKTVEIYSPTNVKVEEQEECDSCTI